MVQHRNTLRAWVPDTVESRTPQALCEQRRHVVDERVALTNRLTSLLKQYFPRFSGSRRDNRDRPELFDLS